MFCHAQTVTIYRGGVAISPTYSSIKTAVAAAIAHDSLVLSAGLFMERLIKIDKAISLTGTITTTKRTEINGFHSKYDSSGTVLVFKNNNFPASTDTLSLQDIDLSNGYYYYDSYGEGIISGGGIFAGKGTVLILKGNTRLYNNYAMASPAYHVLGQGGAIYSLGDVIVKGNSEVFSNRGTNHGGGIFSSKSVQIEENAKLYQNRGKDGGAVYCEGNVTIIDSALVYGNIGANGAGICALGDLIINGNSKLRGNQSFYGDGGGLFSAKSIRISDKVRIDSNSANNGGGIFAYGDVTIEDSVKISHNNANNGAGIFANGIVQISNQASIDSNTAAVSGGGIYLKGSLNLNDSAIIIGNKSNNGGGIFATKSKVYLSNSGIIAANQTKDYGAGLVLLNSNLNLKDSAVIGLNRTDGNFAAGILSRGNDTISISGGQIIGNHSSDTAINGLGMAIFNEKETGASSIISIKNARIFNPTADFRGQNEVFNNQSSSSIVSDSCWWGRSDTTGVIFNYAGGTFSLNSWVVADWSINGGMPIASLASFPVEAYFRLNSGAPLPANMFWMLQGNFRCDSGSFTPALANMTTTNTISSSYSIPWMTILVNILATVDIDTLKNATIITGLTIKEQNQNNKLDFSIFPNPGEGILNINCSEAPKGKVNFVLYNLLGQKIEQHQLQFYNNHSSLLLTVTSGQYIAEMQDANGNIWREKLIIR